MEQMGFECLSQDHEQVALNMALTRINVEHLKASSLPAVAGEAPLAGIGIEPDGQGQAGAGPVERSDEPSFGRRGAGGRERVARDTAGVEPGAGEGRDSRASPLPQVGSSSSILGKRPARAAAPAPAPAQNVRDPPRGGPATGRGLREQGSPPAGIQAAESRPALRAGGPIRIGSEMERSTSSSGGAVAAGPLVGQGRVPKHRSSMALSGKFAKPTTTDEEKLASACFAQASAQGVRGDAVWMEAAAAYNDRLASNPLQMRATGTPVPGDYMYRPVDSANFKMYWAELSETTELQRAGAVAAVLPQQVAGGATGATRGAAAAVAAAAPPPTKLRHEDIMGLSDNKLRNACRARNIGAANSTNRGELIRRDSGGGMFDGGRCMGRGMA
eukprot:g3163.t2